MKRLELKNLIGSIIGGVIIIFFFITVSMVANLYRNDIQNIAIMNSYFGIIFYILITALAIIIAPISTLPLVPIATSLWGWVVAGIISIIGWLIGSIISFFLARKYGKPFIKKFVSLEKLEKYEDYFSEKDTFWTVVFLRMIIPVDVLSYALGLFSKIKTHSFFLSTLIGITPFAFIFSYTAGMSTGLQIITFIEIFAIASVLFILFSKFKKIH